MLPNNIKKNSNWSLFLILKMASGHIKKKRKWLVVRGSFGKQCENNIFREYFLFGAGTKGLVYVANQELPRQTLMRKQYTLSHRLITQLKLKSSNMYQIRSRDLEKQHQFIE